MSRARIEKLQSLLKRVEERRVAPRLHAVAAPVSQPEPVRAVALAPMPAPAAPVAPPAAISVAPAATLPPAADPMRKGPSNSPLEEAMALLDDGGSGPLEVGSLAEPIATAKPVPAPRPLPQDLMLTHRPDAAPSDLVEQPFELIAPRKPAAPREPTIEFETAKVRVSQRELRSIGEEPAEQRPSPQVSAEPLSAPSQTIDAAPILASASPARVVSVVRSEAPKTFGELLDLSLSLRPS